MCFTPEISFATFVIEVLLGVWILKKNPKKTLNQVGAAILFILGAYQLIEFMLCISGDPIFWGRMASLAYTFFPALGVHWVYALRNKKVNMTLIYSLPIIFSTLILTTVNFVQSTSCDRYFITIIYEWPTILSYAYGLYYWLFLLIGGGMLIYYLVNENNKRRRQIYAWGLIGFLSFTLPVYLLIVLFPELGLSFPSILCEFALLFGIAVTYTIYLDGKRH